MDRTSVQTWLDRYVEAWRANDAELIKPLFSDDAVYSYRPYDDPERTIRGNAAIVASWLEEPDPPDSWEAKYEPYAVEGDRAVAVGFSRYLATDSAPEKTYHNAYLLRFDPDGRCAEFHEYYMEEGK
jgi:ketosteroid isomerase-like protein